MYSEDNQDRLLYASEDPYNPSTYAGAWVTGTLDFNGANRSNWDPDQDITKSPMWPYCGKNYSIWRCPSDRSYGDGGDRDQAARALDVHEHLPRRLGRH